MLKFKRRVLTSCKKAFTAFKMKIPPKAERKMKRISRKARRSVKAYSDYIYRVRKECSALSGVAVPGYLWKELCSKIGDEAARLAKQNQRGTITRREVCSAVCAVWKRRQWKSKPAQ